MAEGLRAAIVDANLRTECYVEAVAMARVKWARSPPRDDANAWPTYEKKGKGKDRDRIKGKGKGGKGKKADRERTTASKSQLGWH